MRGISIVLCFLVSFAFMPAAGQTCCDDLHARIEALDAAAKGGRGVSLKLSGQVNRVLMSWDDGAQSDTFIADNIYSSSRSTLSGEDRAAPGLKAGFVIEIEYREVGTSTLTADNDEGSAAVNGDGLRTRLAHGWVEHENLGRFSIGQLSPATNSLVYYKLWTIIVHTSPDVLYNTAFDVRGAGGAASGLRWSDLASGLDSPRGDFVQWVSPEIGGFRLWADAGEDDVTDAALTFDGGFGPFALSAAAGVYRDDETQNATDLRLSALVKHTPSGLYAHAAYAQRDFDAAGRETARLAALHAGAQLRLFGDGLTTIFAEAARYEDIRAGEAIAAPDALGGASAALASSETVRWGAGIMQTFEEAGAEVYAIVQHYDADAEIRAASGASETVALEPWQAVIIGSRVKF